MVAAVTAVVTLAMTLEWRLRERGLCVEREGSVC
jgi:hypothetical protein